MRRFVPRALAAATFVLLIAPPAPAGPAPDPAETRPTDPSRTYPLAPESVRVIGAQYRTEDNPAGQATFTGGPWVGAEVDRGQGLEQITSTAAFQMEFLPEPPPGGRAPFRFVQTDTDTSLLPHEPLGLRLVQSVAPGSLSGNPALTIRIVVRNISEEWSPPGWDMENAYVGFFIDPDVGLTASTNWWNDDRVGYVSTTDGPLAYASDAPGGSDDTSLRVGLVLKDHPLHAFRRWSFADDTESDAGQYALLRGTSHDVPTIDPDGTTPADWRMMLVAGPMTLPRGDARTVTFALVLGDGLGQPRPVRIVAEETTAQVMDVRGSRARFANLPAGAQVLIHDVTGRRVAAIDAAAGGEVTWDAARSGVGSGVYYWRAASREGDARGRIVVVR